MSSRTGKAGLARSASSGDTNDDDASPDLQETSTAHIGIFGVSRACDVVGHPTGGAATVQSSGVRRCVSSHCVGRELAHEPLRTIVRAQTGRHRSGDGETEMTERDCTEGRHD